MVPPQDLPTFQANLVVFTVFFLTFWTLQLRAHFLLIRNYIFCKSCGNLGFRMHSSRLEKTS